MKSVLELAVERHGAEAVLAGMTQEQLAELRYRWDLIGRPEQQMPEGDDWSTWAYVGGRGGGKTRSASEAVREVVEKGHAGQIALVGETAADVRDVMVEGGESSIIKTARPDFRPRYESSKRRLVWPNGATATLFSAEKPDQLRGPQFDFAWCDELAKWRYPEAAWDNLMFGLRLSGPDGSPPRCVVTTTPRPIPLVVSLLRGERQLDGSYIKQSDVVVTTSSTYDNAANLAAAFLRRVRAKYEGTRLGDQELHARLLEEVEGALWSLKLIEVARHRYGNPVPNLYRVVVAVDPPASATGAEAGIIAAGAAAGPWVRGIGRVPHAYVLEDKSRQGSPGEWAREAVDLYKAVKADAIVAEANNGGDMVRHTIHSVDPSVPVKLVHASRGKRTRAEPVASLYEQKRVHHVGGFPQLEDQMVTWVPGMVSPDRMDSLVWAITDLLVGSELPRAPSPPKTVKVNYGKPAR